LPSVRRKMFGVRAAVLARPAMTASAVSRPARMLVPPRADRRSTRAMSSFWASGVMERSGLILAAPSEKMTMERRSTGVSFMITNLMAFFMLSIFPLAMRLLTSSTATRSSPSLTAVDLVALISTSTVTVSSSSDASSLKYLDCSMVTRFLVLFPAIV